jgi:hypothetical protein
MKVLAWIVLGYTVFIVATMLLLGIADTEDVITLAYFGSVMAVAVHVIKKG